MVSGILGVNFAYQGVGVLVVEIQRWFSYHWSWIVVRTRIMMYAVSVECEF